SEAKLRGRLRLNDLSSPTGSSEPKRGAGRRHSLGAAIGLAVGLLICVIPGLAQETYKQPPKEVLDVLNARTTPMASVSPARDYMLLVDTMRNPPISVISDPMLRLAGLRINPRTNGAHLVSYETAISVKRISDGAEHKVALHADAKLSMPEWSPDGKRF